MYRKFVYLLFYIFTLYSSCGILAFPQLVNPKTNRKDASASVIQMNQIQPGNDQLGEVSWSDWDSEENSIPDTDQWKLRNSIGDADQNVLKKKTELRKFSHLPKMPPSAASEESDLCKDLPIELIQEIKGYQDVSNQIIKTVVSGAFKGRTYKELGYFVDKFGSRVAGSENLEQAIDFMLDKMEQDDLDNVHGENVTIPHWVRGEEKATLLTPRVKDLSILGLGYSIGTPPEGITAPVLVVSGFEELSRRAAEAKGKIVVYNEDYESYGKTVVYRGQGANKAAAVGALAVLIRSITPFSLNTPHTGMLDYVDNVPRIPSACITIEDAELLGRLQKQGENLTIHLLMNDTTLPSKISRNSIAEIKGKDRPDQVVVISGHLDSWDVGQGAMDDGGGAFISAEALALLRFLKLQPRRTLRTILWTSEEFGLIGAQQYVEQHAQELEKFNAVFESDIGTFKPLGLDFAGSDGAACIVQHVLNLLAPINATLLRQQSDVGSDIYYFLQKGIPGFSLNNQNDRYFWFHHTQADTMTVENPDELDLCTAVWAVASYVIADLSVDLPRI